MPHLREVLYSFPLPLLGGNDALTSLAYSELT